jgi:hypothetical protein
MFAIRLFLYYTISGLIIIITLLAIPYLVNPHGNPLDKEILSVL